MRRRQRRGRPGRPNHDSHGGADRKVPSVLGSACQTRMQSQSGVTDVNINHQPLRLFTWFAGGFYLNIIYIYMLLVYFCASPAWLVRLSPHHIPIRQPIDSKMSDAIMSLYFHIRYNLAPFYSFFKLETGGRAGIDPGRQLKSVN